MKHTDRIVSLSAMAVGISSLFIIIYQTNLMRKAQSASALPYLMIAINSNQNGTHVTLSNAGVGPALIEDVRVRYQGRVTEGDAHDFYLITHPNSDSLLGINKIKPGRLIPAGASIDMLGIGQTQRGQQFLAELLHCSKWRRSPRAGTRLSARRTMRKPSSRSYTHRSMASAGGCAPTASFRSGYKRAEGVL